MKSNNLYLILISFLFASSFSYAQIDEKEIAMSLGNQNALTMKIDNVSEKDLEKYLKDYFRDFGKVKYNRKAKEYYIHNAKVKSISDNKIDIYAKTIDVNKDILIALFVDNGLGFVNSEEYEAEYKGAAAILKDFDIYVKKLLVEEELKEAESNLSSIERDLKRLEKDNERYHKTIEDARKKIAEMEEAIETNVSEQDAKRQEIIIHQEGIEEIKSRLEAIGKKKS